MQPVNQPSRLPTSHLFIHWCVQSFVHQQSMYSSSILSATQTSYHPSIHKAIYPISLPSKRHQSIRPCNYQTGIHPFIRRAIITSNHPYSSNLCTYRSSVQPFKPSKHLIIHSTLKLPIQSVIRPSGISLSIHITTQAAIHLFIQWFSCHTLILPTNHTSAIYDFIVHPFLPFSHPNLLSSIHPQSYLSNRSIIQKPLIFSSE